MSIDLKFLYSWKISTFVENLHTRKNLLGIQISFINFKYCKFYYEAVNIFFYITICLKDKLLIFFKHKFIFFKKYLFRTIKKYNNIYSKNFDVSWSFIIRIFFIRIFIIRIFFYQNHQKKFYVTSNVFRDFFFFYT